MNTLIERIDMAEAHCDDYLREVMANCKAEINRLLLANETLKGLCEDYQAQIKAQGGYVPMTNSEWDTLDLEKNNDELHAFEWEKIVESEVIQRAKLIVKEYTMSNELRLEALVRYDKDDNGVIDVHTDFELMEALRDELANPQPKSQIRADFLVRTEKELKMLEKFGGGHELGFTQRLLRDYKHVLPNLMTVDDVITHLENTGYVVVQAKKWHALQDKHEAVLNDDTHDNDCTHDVVDCLSPIPDFADVFTSEDFENEETLGSINSDDGHGYWATAGSESKLSVWSPKPEWATHVTWYNK